MKMVGSVGAGRKGRILERGDGLRIVAGGSIAARRRCEISAAAMPFLPITIDVSNTIQTKNKKHTLLFCTKSPLSPSVTQTPPLSTSGKLVKPLPCSSTSKLPAASNSSERGFVRPVATTWLM